MISAGNSLIPAAVFTKFSQHLRYRSFRCNRFTTALDIGVGYLSIFIGHIVWGTIIACPWVEYIVSMRDSHPLGSDQLLASVQKLQKYFLQVILCQLLQTGFPAISQKRGWWAGCRLYFSRHQQAKLLRSRCSAASCLLKNNCDFSLSFTEPSHSKNAAQLLPTTNPEFPDEWNHLSASQGLCRLSFLRWLPSYFGS